MVRWLAAAAVQVLLRCTDMALVCSTHTARRVFAFASHGLFSGPAFERIKNSCLEEVVTVNTIPLADGAEDIPQLKQLSVAPLIAETIQRIHTKKSISQLFSDEAKKM